MTFFDEVYKRYCFKVLNDVRSKYPSDYPIFMKIFNSKMKDASSFCSIYVYLTKLRSIEEQSIEQFDKPLSQLTNEELDLLSSMLYSKYDPDTLRSISTILREFYTHLKFDKDYLRDLFPYPSKKRVKSFLKPPPFVPGHVLDRVIFAIDEDMYRSLFCLLRITGGRIEEAVLLQYKHIIDEGDRILVRFEHTKTGEYREIPLNWHGFERHLKEFLSWIYDKHPLSNERPENAWIFFRPTKINEPLPRHYSYLVLRRTVEKLSQIDPKVKKYAKYINQHQFRHTRAYELVLQNWNIRLIMAYMGWKKPEMVYRYTQSLELKQFHEQIMKQQKQEPRSTKTIRCPRCNYLIQGSFNFCPNCGFNLRSSPADIKELLKLKQSKKRIKKILKEILKEIGYEELLKMLK